jgi:hypothetical protein
MRNVTTVFLSSTAKDLQSYRDAVYQAIGKMAGYYCVRMEDFGPRDGTAAVVCEKEVAETDIFVGLIGHLHGSCPNGSTLSFTEGEYAAATQASKPRLMFLATEDFPVPFNLRESEEAFQKQRKFRERVGRERVVEFFRDPQVLATGVVAALQKLQEEHPRRGGGENRPKRRQLSFPAGPDCAFR